MDESYVIMGDCDLCYQKGVLVVNMTDKLDRTFNICCLCIQDLMDQVADINPIEINLEDLEEQIENNS